MLYTFCPALPFCLVLLCLTVQPADSGRVSVPMDVPSKGSVGMNRAGFSTKPTQDGGDFTVQAKGPNSDPQNPHNAGCLRPASLFTVANE